MAPRSIIAVGHSALDFVYRIEAFPVAPTKLRAIEHIASGGGMAANAAVTVARLGGSVGLWSRIGDDEAGAIIRGQLVREGVDVVHVRAYVGRRSPTAAVIVDAKGERLIVSEDDHELPLDASWLPLEAVAEARVVMSDLTWLEATEAAFRAARAAGVTTLLDVDLGSGVLIPKVIGLTDYAIFSAPALERFVEGADDEARLQRLIGLGVRHAGVTMGGRGYRWINRNGGAGQQPAFPVAPVDTTGAGDAFHGAFAWALSEGNDEAVCARIASAAAALSCRRLGARAALPTREEVEEFAGS